MHWFYSQLDIVYVNSEDYRKCWIERGIPSERLRILPRGLDTRLFHPAKRDRSFWTARGLRDGEVGMLFVCLLYTSPSPRDRQKSRMPSSA